MCVCNVYNLLRIVLHHLSFISDHIVKSFIIYNLLYIKCIWNYYIYCIYFIIKYIQYIGIYIILYIEDSYYTLRYYTISENYIFKKLICNNIVVLSLPIYNSVFI